MHERQTQQVTDGAMLIAIALLLAYWVAAKVAFVPLEAGGVFSRQSPAEIARVSRHATAHLKVPAPVSHRRTRQIWLGEEYQSSSDLYGFYLRANDLGAAGLGEAKYFASQALEECFAVSRMGWEEYAARLVVEGASRELRACQGFVNQPIRPAEIVDMLAAGAALGDARARARMLLFRDIGASLEDTRDLVAELLATHDPFVLRDVDAYLGRGRLAAIAEGSSLEPEDLGNRPRGSPG